MNVLTNVVNNSNEIVRCWGSDINSNMSYHFTSESLLHRSEMHQLIVHPSRLRYLLTDIICIRVYNNRSMYGSILDDAVRVWSCPLVPDWVNVVSFKCADSHCIEDCQLVLDGLIYEYLYLVGFIILVLGFVTYLVGVSLGIYDKKIR